MDLVAFDLETHLIQPGLVAPPIVCGSIALTPHHGQLLSVSDVRLFLDDMLPSRTIVGANIAFDLICVLVKWPELLPRVFCAYAEGRVYDVQIAQALHAIANGHLGYDPLTGAKMRGRYSLQECVRQCLGRDNAKANDRYRLSYALLEGTPIEEWPLEARTYPVDDAVNTLEVALAQRGELPSIGRHRLASSKGSDRSCSRCHSDQWSKSCLAREAYLNQHEVVRQTYAAFCLALGAAWGFRVNQASVDELERRYLTEHTAASEQPFRDAKILRADGTENQSIIRRLVAEAYGACDSCAPCQGEGKVPSPKTSKPINCTVCGGTGLLLGSDVPLTEKGGVGKGRDVLYESGDEALISYAATLEGRKVSTVYIPFLRSAGNVPLVLRPNVIVETGRVSYDGAIMLLPRSGGVRECIEARPGYVFSSEDYKAGELITHAQSCLWIVGFSELAKALNAGLDAHTALAGTMAGKQYADLLALVASGDKTAKNLRQAAKPANFGFPGRMGPGKLVLQQRKGGPDTKHASGKYKGLRFCLLMRNVERCGVVKVTEWNGRPLPPACKACLECATELRAAWRLQWPENLPYFDHVKAIDDSGARVVQHVTKRLRGFKRGSTGDDGEPVNAGNAIANGYFQGLLADAAKNALMRATAECYLPTKVASKTKYTSTYESVSSPLLGSRIIVFQHDELVCEHPEAIAHDAATRVSEIMTEELRIICPDLEKAVEAEPTLMRRLYKGAECTRDARGRLVPWEPV